MFEKREEEDGWMRDLYAYWGIDDPAVKEFVDRRYIERLVGCVENVTNPGCTLTTKEKLADIRKMITSDRAVEAVHNAKPHSTYMKIMLLPIRWKSVGLTYLEGKVISKVKSSDTRLFARLKAGR